MDVHQELDEDENEYVEVDSENHNRHGLLDEVVGCANGNRSKFIDENGGNNGMMSTNFQKLIRLAVGRLGFRADVDVEDLSWRLRGRMD